MDGKTGLTAYDKYQLQFSYSCSNPTVGSDVAAASSNNCCSLVFNWNSGTNTVTKNNVDFTKYCDGLYKIEILARSPIFPAYTQTYTADLEVKYDVSYLLSSSQYFTPDPLTSTG